MYCMLRMFFVVSDGRVKGGRLRIGRRCWHIATAFAFVSGVFGLVSSIRSAHAVLRPIAVSGAPHDSPLGPNVSANLMYSTFDRAAAINDAGNVLFVGDVWDGINGAVRIPGVWYGNVSERHSVAVVGSGVSGEIGNAVDFYNLQLAGNGDYLFESRSSANSAGGLFVGDASGIRLVRRFGYGDSAPDVPVGVSFRGFSPQLGAADAVAAVGTLTGVGVNGGNDEGIWFGGPDDFRLVARTGESAVGTNDGSVYMSFDRGMANSRGQYAFHTLLTGANLSNGIWGGEQGSLRKIVRRGEPIAGAAAGETLSAAGDDGPRLNDHGDIAFSGQFQGPNVNINNIGGIWAGDFDSLALVARDGQTPPGVAASSRWSSIGGSLALGDGGQVAFHARLQGPGVSADDNTGIWSGLSGGLRLTVREGMSAPGTPNGLEFSNIGEDPEVGPQGQVLFYSELRGPGLYDWNRFGVWLADADGNIHLVARIGDLLDLDPGPAVQLGRIRDLFQTSQVAGRTTAGGGDDSFGRVSLHVRTNAGEALMLYDGDAPRTEMIAFSVFDEPTRLSATYEPTPSSRELGFTTDFVPTMGAVRVGIDSPTVGSPFSLIHRSAAVTTTFGLVDLTQWNDVTAAVQLLIANTTYETGDFLTITVTNGLESITLIDAHGIDGVNNDELEFFALRRRTTLWTAVPDDWAEAWLEIRSSTDASNAREEFFFDAVSFAGAAVPEPNAVLLAAGVVILAFLRRYIGRATRGVRPARASLNVGA